MATGQKPGAETRPSLREIALRSDLTSAKQVRQAVVLAGYTHKNSQERAVRFWQDNKKKGNPMNRKTFAAILCIGIAVFGGTACGGKSGRGAEALKAAPGEFGDAYGPLTVFSKFEGGKWNYEIAIVEDGNVLTKELETEAVDNGNATPSGNDTTTQNVMPRRTVVLKIEGAASDIATTPFKDSHNRWWYKASTDSIGKKRFNFFDRGTPAVVKASVFYAVGGASGLDCKAEFRDGLMYTNGLKASGLPGRNGDKLFRTDIGSDKLITRVAGLTLGENEGFFVNDPRDFSGSLYPIADDNNDGYVVYEVVGLTDGTYQYAVRRLKALSLETGRVDATGSPFAFTDPTFGLIFSFTKEGGSIYPTFDASIVKQATEVWLNGQETAELSLQVPKDGDPLVSIVGRFSNGHPVDLTNAGRPFVVWTSTSNAAAEFVEGEGRIDVKSVTGVSQDVTLTVAWDALPAMSIVLKLTPNLKKISLDKAEYALTNATPATTVMPTVTKTFENDATDLSKAGITFRSENASVATVDATTGEITPVALGETTIIAATAADEFTSSAKVVVTKQVKEIALIGPDSVTLVAGSTQVYRLKVSYTDDSEEEINSGFDLTSNNAAVSVSGVTATAVSAGSADIGATYSTIANAAGVTKKIVVIGQAQGPVTALAIEPASAQTLETGRDLSFKVFEMHGAVKGVEVTTRVVTTLAKSTTDSTVAAGTFHAGAMGENVIKVSLASLSATLTVNVTDFIIKATLNDGNALSTAVGETKRVKASIEFGASPATDNVTLLIFTPATGNEFFELTLDTTTNEIVVKGKKKGTTSLIARSGSQASTTMAITVASVPDRLTMADSADTAFPSNIISGKAGDPNQAVKVFLVSKTDLATGEESEDVTTEALLSKNSSEAFALEGKSIKFVKEGTGTMTATARGKASAPVTVNVSKSLQSIALSGGTSVAAGSDLQLTTTATYLGAANENVTTSTAYLSSDTAKATVGASTGLVSGVAEGSATITATFGGETATVVITVTKAVNSLTMTTAGGATGLNAGATLQLTVTANNVGGSTDDVSSTAVYTTSDATKATVSTAGLVSGIGDGSVTISATFSGKSASVNLTVTKVLQSIALSGGSSVAAGSNLQLVTTATYLGAANEIVTTSTAYQSSDVAKATVGASTGLVSGIAEGSATITATFGTKTATVVMTVTKAVESLTMSVAGNVTSLTVGMTVQLTVISNNVGGSTDNVTTSATYASLDPSKATVSSVGLVSAVSATATPVVFTATYGGKSASVSLTITPASEGDEFLAGNTANIRFVSDLGTASKYKVRFAKARVAGDKSAPFYTQYYVNGPSVTPTPPPALTTEVTAPDGSVWWEFEIIVPNTGDQKYIWNFGGKYPTSWAQIAPTPTVKSSLYHSNAAGDGLVAVINVAARTVTRGTME